MFQNKDKNGFQHQDIKKVQFRLDSFNSLTVSPSFFSSPTYQSRNSEPIKKEKNQMKRFLKSRLALSTVVTTLIILVVSVLLAGVVTYFAINVTSTRVQEESLHLTKQHVWYSTSNVTHTAEAAIMIINTGGRDVVIDKISVRGQECDWVNVYYNITTGAISSDLAFNSTLTNGGTITIGTDGDFTFLQATTDLILKSGYTMIIYIDDPDSISINDVGVTVSLAVFTAQATYYREANVEAMP